MPSLVENVESFWNWIKEGRVSVPSQVTIPSDHIDVGNKLGSTFEKDRQYFQVVINELYLHDYRHFWSTFSPMVFVVTEFFYDKKQEAVPFVVGPDLLAKYGKLVTVPTGMIFSNTRVAGWSPYRGDRLTLTVILCQVEQTNYAQKLLQLVEDTAGALDFSTALSSYVKLGHAVLNGVEMILNIGGTSRGVIGKRQSFNSEDISSEVLKPSYFALVNLPEDQLDKKQLWVRQNGLVYGTSIDEAQPFRDADYVLYSIGQTLSRSDDTTLPFYPLFEQVKLDASKTDEESWKRARMGMLTLYTTMKLSPDLINTQADELGNQYMAEMNKLHDDVIRISNALHTDEAKARLSPEASISLETELESILASSGKEIDKQLEADMITFASNLGL